ncbi:MAG: prepilin-type N-terminal cleavage/methylation domain-containing protein [Candidatus Paceibacterota bacterium]
MLSRTKKRKIFKGFTLIEFLIVTAVIGIMSSMAVGYLSGSREQTKDTRIALAIAQIESIAEIVHLNDGKYDALCSSETSLSTERGLDVIQNDITANEGTVACFAEDDNYCISALLNNGLYFYIKDNISAKFGNQGCTSATVGGDEDDDDDDGDDDGNGVIIDTGCYTEESLILQIGGSDHTLSLREDGTVWAWGRNNYGQVGDNSVTERHTPVQVKGVGGVDYLTSIIEVTGRGWHSLALKSDGTVYAWGRSLYGALGDGTTITKYAPVQVKGVGGTGNLTNIKGIGTGWWHSLAIREDGTVFAWGGNQYGQLGDNSTTDSNTPVQVKGVGGSGYLTNVLQVAGGNEHTVALREDGTVYAWGKNEHGQLGDNSTTDRYTPVQVKGVGGEGFLTNAISVAAGSAYSLALLEDGTVYTWGNNWYGQLGDNTTEHSSAPVKVKGVGGVDYLTDIVAIASGWYHSLALKSDGTVYAWGSNLYGGLGVGVGSDYISTPVEVKGIGGVGSLTGIETIGTGHRNSFAVGSDGAVYAWGLNDYGELGDDTVESRFTPVKIWNLSPGLVVEIEAGAYHSLGIRAGGTVFAWGYNSAGQLGDNTTLERLSGVQVKDSTGDDFFENAEGIAAGAYHSLALKSDGTVYAWGFNGGGQLGDDSTTNSSLPVQVKGVGGSGNLTNATSVAAGYFHSLALKSDGTVYAWGYNNYGQLGDNSTTERHVPIQVSITSVSAIAAGDYHSLALKSDGTVWAWGKNDNGQLGDNSTTERLVPIQVKGVGGEGNLSDIIDVSAGVWFSLALKSDGTVYAWGYNNYGQLGNDDSVDSSVPVQVKGVGGEGNLSNISAISAGGSHSLALKSDGTVYSWGRNNYGQLGDASITTRRTPVKVKDEGGENELTNVSSISAGIDNHSLALKEEGIVYSWGRNNYGQLGNDTITNTAAPSRTCDLPAVGEEGEPPVPVEGCTDENAVNYNPEAVTDDNSCEYSYSRPSQIAAGFLHSLVVREDGTVYAWGRNNYGQLGDSSTVDWTTPVLIPSKVKSSMNYFTDALDVKAGYYHSLALKSDGTVWAWGYGNYGQLGINFTTSYTPIQVKGVGGSGYLTNIIAIGIGNDHSLALKSDGTVYAWGRNYYGYLGDDTTTNRSTPVQVKGVGGEGYLTSITDIAAGVYHTLALKSDGTVYSWGYNGIGQLGDGTTVNKHTPVQVKGVGGEGYLTDIVAIAAGDYHSLALKSDGTVWAWGENVVGQLGDNTTTNRSTPVQVKGVGGEGYLTNVASVAAGNAYSLALLDDGTVYALGYNGSGQLGDNTTTNRSTPVQVKGPFGIGYLTDIVGIAAGWKHSLATREDGTAWAWGYNGWGQLGDRTTTDRHFPVKVLFEDEPVFEGSIAQISSGKETGAGNHTVALLDDGTVYAWGYNNIGQLGDGTQTNRRVPVQVKSTDGTIGLTNIIEVAAGGNHSLALATGGTVYAWGWNAYGQLGDNTTTSRVVPVEVKGPGGAGLLENVINIAAGGRFSLALKNDGTVWAWGRNGSGQLGDGTTTDKLTPVQVRGVSGSGYLTDIVAIAAGGLHSLALKSDGTVYAWGENVVGQLGDVDTYQTNSTSPVKVNGVGGEGYLTNVAAISAGYVHSMALKNDGTVFTWGRNYNGQLGDGSGLIEKQTPVQVKGVGGVDYLTDIEEISGGHSHSLALKSDGTVFAWGWNYNGQLGDDTTSSKSTPVQVKGKDGIGYLTDIISIAGGSYHSVALKSNSTIWTWGYNIYGQLGNNTTTNSDTPVLVLWGTDPIIYGCTDPEANNFNPDAEIDDSSCTYPDPVFGCTDFEALNYNPVADTDDGSCEYHLDPLVQIDGGAYHSIAVTNSGVVYTWGSNTNGQLGDGTTVSRTVPIQVKGVGGVNYLTNVKSVAAGGRFSLALKNDGTVWAWGDNWSGKLGDGTTTSRLTPIQVRGPGGSGYLTSITSISGGWYSATALKSDGTVWAWGYNIHGMLGDGTTITKYTPVQVKGVGGSGYLTNIIAIDSNDWHSLALKSDGTVWAWGANHAGQLGDNTTTEMRLTPVQVVGPNGSGYLTDIIKISAGYHHSLALKSDGTVWAWGENSLGQRGDGTTVLYNYTPVQVVGPGGVGYLTNITDIAAGFRHSFALKSDGTVWAWGGNWYGNLGDNTITNRRTPVQVKGPGGIGYFLNVIKIGAGFHHSLAIKSDGTGWAWGENGGRLGDGTTIERHTPVRIGSPEDPPVVSSRVVQISGGYEHSLALKEDGTVYSWGRNHYGQLGIGTTVNEYSPIQVRGPAGVGYLTNVENITKGGRHSLAVKDDGTVWAWGWNNAGQLGDGTLTNRYTPVQVKGVGGTGYLTNATSVAGGYSFSLALKSDGTVYAWGYNVNGQLGNGTTTDSVTVPVQVKGVGGVGYLTDITSITAGNYHALALKSDGTVYAWGRNYNGELGDGTQTNKYTPVQVKGVGGAGYLTNIESFIGGASYSLALKSDGTVYSWGYNEYGALGDGTTTNKYTPVQVKGVGGVDYLTSIVHVAAGYHHTLALKSDGTVYSWGYNEYGALGDGTTTNKYTPVQVKGVGGAGYLSSIENIWAGSVFFSMALKDDGTVWTWGSNEYGQLGDGTTTTRYTPVQVLGL